MNGDAADTRMETHSSVAVDKSGSSTQVARRVSRKQKDTRSEKMNKIKSR